MDLLLARIACYGISSLTIIANRREKHKGPLLGVVESPGGPERLRHSIPFLTEAPCCQCRASPSDNDYPALGWQAPAARAAIHHLVSFPGWIRVGAYDL